MTIDDIGLAVAADVGVPYRGYDLTEGNAVALLGFGHYTVRLEQFSLFHHGDAWAVREVRAKLCAMLDAGQTNPKPNQIADFAAWIRDSQWKPDWIVRE